MQGKGLVKFFLILLVIIFGIQWLLTIPTRNVESAADSYAQKLSNSATGAQKADILKASRAHYLDSMSNEKVFSIPLFKDYTYEDLKKQQLALGLDLKGGMSVLLQVDLRDLLLSLSNNSTDPEFKTAMDNASKRLEKTQTDYITLFSEEYEKVANGKKLAPLFTRNETLKGSINLNSSNTEVIRLLRSKANETVDLTFNRLKKRIDGLGVAQPNVSLDASRDLIVVELPGMENPQRARNFLQQAAKLEFWDVYRTSDPGVMSALQEADNRLKNIKAGVIDTLASANDTTANKLGQGPLLAIFQPNVQQQMSPAVLGLAAKNKIPIINEYLSNPTVKSLFPRDLEFRWSQDPIKTKADAKADGLYELYALKAAPGKGGPGLEGDHVVKAVASPDPQTNEMGVSLEMDNAGAKKWGQMTTKAAADQNRQIAIVLDDEVVSAPSVRNAILTGNSSITGGFTIQEGNDLASILQIGKLPAKTQIVQESLVGPSLGQDNINKSLLSIALALLAVMAFMVFYYRTGGIVAIIALLFNLFFIVGTLTSLGTVLTLSGIAGIVLTMGIAVDVNVILYERIREELNAGKDIKTAIKDGFKHSLPAIIDGNVTTFLTACILAYFGLGPVKGFGIVLAIGIVFTLFTGLLLTRYIIEWWMGKGKDISFFSDWSQRAFKGINIDWMKMRKRTYLISAAYILFGLLMWFKNGGFELGVDFTGGYSYNVQFDKAIDVEKVRGEMEKTFEGASTVVKSVSTNNTYNITTGYLIDEKGATTDEKVLGKLFEAANKLSGGNLTKEAFAKSDASNTHVISSTKVGSTVADDIKKSSVWATFFGLLTIGLYILMRFNRWQYSIGAVIATFHDVLIMLSTFAILRGLMPFSMEVNQDVVAAILTIIGYSINDTVIVYDRIREYTHLYTNKPMSEVINSAINSTLSRTIITALTVVIVLLVLFIFGGSSIRGFAFALLIGVFAGTYSSIFIASPVMMDLSKNLDLREKVVSSSATSSSSNKEVDPMATKKPKAKSKL